MSKQDAMYEEPARGTDYCRDCKHFEAPNRCERVHGIISPKGWCKLFMAKSRMASTLMARTLK